MPDGKRKIRLYVVDDLAPERVLGLPADQAHYLRSVMRGRQGQQITLFNGRDGEWQARIEGLGKGWASLAVGERRREQAGEPDLWLCFAPIKRSRIDVIAEKATELGVSRLQPVFTRRTDAARINLKRLQARAIEAAEQCERLSVPELCEPLPLDRLLAAWPADRGLIYCDEREGAQSLPALARSQAEHRAWAILIGPEGGFEAAERAQILALPAAHSVTLGRRILRTETAALAALAAWQMLCEDESA